MSPFSEINVFELSRYTMILMTNIEVLLSGAPHMSHTQSQERRWSEGPGPEHALPPPALNTPLLNKQNLSRLGQCWIMMKKLQTCEIFLFHFQGASSFKATNEQYVLWQPFVAWGHCLGTHFIQNLTQNIVLTFMGIVYKPNWQKM